MKKKKRQRKIFRNKNSSFNWKILCFYIIDFLQVNKTWHGINIYIYIIYKGKNYDFIKILIISRVLLLLLVVLLNFKIFHIFGGQRLGKKFSK
jgi:hypothetical protein